MISCCLIVTAYLFDMREGENKMIKCVCAASTRVDSIRFESEGKWKSRTRQIKKKKTSKTKENSDNGVASNMTRSSGEKT